MKLLVALSAFAAVALAQYGQQQVLPSPQRDAVVAPPQEPQVLLPPEATLSPWQQSCMKFVCSIYQGEMLKQCNQYCKASANCDHFSQWCWQSYAPFRDVNSCVAGRSQRCECLIKEASTGTTTRCSTEIAQDVPKPMPQPVPVVHVQPVPVPVQPVQLPQQPPMATPYGSPAMDQPAPVPAPLPAPVPAPLDLFSNDCVNFICSKHDGIMKNQCIRMCQSSTTCDDFSKWCWQNVAPWTDSNTCFKGRNARCQCLIAEKSNTKQTHCSFEGAQDAVKPIAPAPLPVPVPVRPIQAQQQPPMSIPYGSPAMDQPAPLPAPVPASINLFSNDCVNFICSKHDGNMKNQCIRMCQSSSNCDDFSKWCWQNVAPWTDSNTCFKGRTARCQCLIAEKSNTKQTRCAAPAPADIPTPLVPAPLPVPTPLNMFQKDCSDFVCSKYDGIRKNECLQTCQASINCDDFAKSCWQNIVPFTDTNSCFKGRKTHCQCLTLEKSATKQTRCSAPAPSADPAISQPIAPLPAPVPSPFQANCLSFVCTKFNGKEAEECKQSCQSSISCEQFGNWCWLNSAAFLDTKTCFQGRISQCQCMMNEKSQTAQTVCLAPTQLPQPQPLPARDIPRTSIGGYGQIPQPRPQVLPPPMAQPQRPTFGGYGQPLPQSPPDVVRPIPQPLPPMAGQYQQY